MKKIKNIEDVRNEMIETYDDLKCAKIGMQDAKVRATLTGRMISSAKVQMEYNKMTGNDKPIKFLKCDD